MERWHLGQIAWMSSWQSNKMIALFLRSLGPNLSDTESLLKLNCFIALHTNEVVMMMGGRLIDFVVFMAFCKFEFP